MWWCEEREEEDLFRFGFVPCEAEIEWRFVLDLFRAGFPVVVVVVLAAGGDAVIVVSQRRGNEGEDAGMKIRRFSFDRHFLKMVNYALETVPTTAFTDQKCVQPFVPLNRAHFSAFLRPDREPRDCAKSHSPPSHPHRSPALTLVRTIESSYSNYPTTPRTSSKRSSPPFPLKAPPSSSAETAASTPPR